MKKKLILSFVLCGLLLGFVSVASASEYYLVPVEKYEKQEQLAAEAMSLNQQLINKIQILKSQNKELDSKLKKSNQLIIILENQQKMLKDSYSSKIAYLENCNQALEKESKEYKKKIKKQKLENTLLYSGLAILIVKAIT